MNLHRSTRQQQREAPLIGRRPEQFFLHYDSIHRTSPLRFVITKGTFDQAVLLDTLRRLV